MDFAQAKIHSLVMLATSEGVSSEASGQQDDPERMKFKEVESTFLRRFSMPQEEKLVNCKWMLLLLLCKRKASQFLSFTLTDYGCSYWKSALPRQGWLYLSINHLCFYSYFMGAETVIILRWSSITVSIANSTVYVCWVVAPLYESKVYTECQYLIITWPKNSRLCNQLRATASVHFNDMLTSKVVLYYMTLYM